VPEVDWVARFRDEFRGARAGCFRVRPIWRDEAPRPGELTLLVDPGGAFGTGTHESTRLCLLELERIQPRSLVIDVGCGSGLLAIAALARGWRHALAIDIDPAAVAEARRHAALNRARLTVVLGDGLAPIRPGRCELLLANLARELLIDHCEALTAALAPGGIAVLSGLLREDLAEVERTFERHGRTRARFEGDWVALTLETPR
jgi:ribosomal protein L11 methyltransferase